MPNDRGRYSYDYLLSKGLKPIAAAGIVGNLSHESNFSTTVKGKADNMGSVGIAQWHSERKQGLFKFAEKQGKNYSNLDTQLDYIVHELNTDYKKALEGITNAKNTKESTKAFMDLYERPAEWAKRESFSKRVAAADAITSYSYKGDGSNPYQTQEANSDFQTQEETKPERNFFPEYQAIGSSQAYGTDEEDTDIEETAQTISDKAKASILAKQNERNFLEELSKTYQEEEPQQAQPQQEVDETDYYQAPQIELPQYEQQELPIAQDGILFKDKQGELL